MVNPQLGYFLKKLDYLVIPTAFLISGAKNNNPVDTRIIPPIIITSFDMFLSF